MKFTSVNRMMYSGSFLRGISRSKSVSKTIGAQLWMKMKDLGILRPFRGTRAGKFVKSRLSAKVPKIIIQESFDYSTVSEANFHSFNIQQHKGKTAKYPRADFNRECNSLFRFCSFNAQSAVNKSAILNEYLSCQQIDLAAITETWFTSNDAAAKAACIPDGYKIHDFCRSNRRGGGLAIAYRDNICTKQMRAADMTSFEYAEWLTTIGSSKLLLSVIYRPPYSSNHPVSIGTFLNDFSDYLESLILCKHSILITGDFNIHVDDTSSPDTKSFHELILSFGLQQLVKFPTHQKGHTLDLIISRQSDSLCCSTPVPGCYLSDHCTILCDLNINRPRLSTNTISYRKMKDIDISAFRADLSTSLLTTNCSDDLNSLITTYNATLSDLLDKHAPKRTRTMVTRPTVPWFNNDIRDSKRQQRKAERKWRSNRTDDHLRNFKSARNRTTFLMNKARREFYSAFINENSADQRKLFITTKKLLNLDKDLSLPPHTSKEVLATQFGEFFVKKIYDIRSKIDNERLEECSDSAAVCETTLVQQQFRGQQLTDFKPLSKDDIMKLINKARAKSCILDPIPSCLVKQCSDILQPSLMEIINNSLVSGEFPNLWKEAIVSPLLKKANLEPTFQNYRPVSNLSFISKLCEKAVYNQIQAHLVKNDLYPTLQSAYRENHSTETALLKVRNDILLNMNSQHVTLLVLLDLSAAFDTIDHCILLKRLQSSFGITGNALKWISSYLSDRSQRVCVEGALSESFNLDYGVPQGSCLGPLLFTLYGSEIFNIISSHLPSTHGFADDTQLYLSFKPDKEVDQQTALYSMERCIEDVRRWMRTDKLKLNEGKTEFLVIGTKQQLQKVKINHITVGTEKITPSPSARNLGSWFDENFNMSLHVSKSCSASYYYLHNIRQIRKYLTPATTKTLIHAFVTSRVDYCNSLLYGVPISIISRLQKVQNTAARLIQQLTRFCHITPVLKDLHWLPVKFRIHYKILIITFKIIHNTAPAYLQEMIQLSSSTRYSLRSSDGNFLKRPSFKSLATLGDRSFTMAAPFLWNSLPKNIRLENDYESFKHLLKTYLFNLAFN